MFAVAQIMYIFAFGFTPLNLRLGAVMYMCCSIGKIRAFEIPSAMTAVDRHLLLYSISSHIRSDARLERCPGDRSANLYSITHYHGVESYLASAVLRGESARRVRIAEIAFEFDRFALYLNPSTSSFRLFLQQCTFLAFSR